MAQGGNVSEWLESAEYGAGSQRNLRGGNWQLDALFMAATWEGGTSTTEVSNERGFRVAATFVPEPASAALATVAIFSWFFAGRRRMFLPLR
jgi:hypothetical protein